ncbi:MAG: tRNA pseudouridine(55) synthase TruB [Endomicrobium sp.]|jgi:tRNA pseudouridine55 synthase|nr:tRNA pseudouridine(55) synthase TruB [Endomicrobium sp.]
MSSCYSDISGMLLVDKPSNITSFKVVKNLRKILNIKKAGHCGTLDPLANGLLLVLLGKATKLQNKFMKKDKVYNSTFLLGVTTDTYDLDGKITSLKEVSYVNAEKIKTSVDKFKGEIFQVPPMYSALKVKGKKLCNLARKGVEIKRNARKITIYGFDILNFDKNIINVRVHCSSGTYIRCLAKDLGETLGCGAAVKTLRREKISNFDVKDAIPFSNEMESGKILKNIIPYETLVDM